MARRALIVGINTYEGDNDLNACVADAKAIAEVRPSNSSPSMRAGSSRSMTVTSSPAPAQAVARVRPTSPPPTTTSSLLRRGGKLSSQCLVNVRAYESTLKNRNRHDPVIRCAEMVAESFGWVDSLPASSQREI